MVIVDDGGRQRDAEGLRNCGGGGGCWVGEKVAVRLEYVEMVGQ